MKAIRIAGQEIEVSPLNKGEQSGLWLELIANFEIGKIEFNNIPMLIFSQKPGVLYSPLQLKNLLERIEKVKGLPSVFYFDRLLTYERDRLVEKGVYFVVSDKYAFLPMLIINRNESEARVKETFSPSTQYLLLYHLQIACISGKSIKELEGIIPYKYKTIAKAVKQLEQLGFLQLTGGKEKRIVIEKSNHDLWSATQSHLISPVKATYFSSASIKEGYISSHSAQDAADGARADEQRPLPQSLEFSHQRLRAQCRWN